MKYIAVAAGVAAAITMGAALAIAAHSKASTLELVVIGGHETVPASPAFPFGIRHRGTFTSSSPFCSSGTFVDLTLDLLNGSDDTRLYTCNDNSGTLTLQHETWGEHKAPWTDTWHVIAGTGRYTDLRGKGDYRGELVSGDPADALSVVFRSTLTGFADFDSVAPTIKVLTAKVTKLRRPSSAYSIRLTLSMRDNEPGNTISYTVAAEPAGGGLYLIVKKGSAAPGKVTMALRIQPTTGARAVLLQLGAQDVFGNARWSDPPTDSSALEVR